MAVIKIRGADGTVHEILSIKGDPGPAGEQGPAGERGPSGERGPAGSDANVTAENIENALGYKPAGSDQIGAAVLYTEQSLADDQQKQARDNIAATAKTDVFDYTSNPTFTNIFDSVAIEYGKELETDGSVNDSASPLAVTGWIPVSAGDVIRVNDDFLLYCVEGKNTPRVILYDSSFVKLTHINNTSMQVGGYFIELLEKNADGHIVSFRVNRPTEAAYMRICNNTEVIGENPVLTINEEINYEMGYGAKLNPKVKIEYSQLLNAPKNNCWNILPYERLAIAYSSIGRKPINTVEHFTDAAENFGYNVLKADLRPTSDGELVCCHDAGFTFDSNGHITTYDSGNSTAIHNVTAATCLGYSFSTGEHPCLVGDYLDVCRAQDKIAWITIRNEYMDVVIPKLISELKAHNMLYATIINSMTYESLVQWREADSEVMVNYTLAYGAEADTAAIDKAIALGYCSLSAFSLTSAAAEPTADCNFEYARQNGVRLFQAIAYNSASPDVCYAMGYDGVTIGIPWEPVSAGGSADTYSKAEIDAIMGSYITDIDTLVGGDG